MKKWKKEEKGKKSTMIKRECSRKCENCTFLVSKEKMKKKMTEMKFRAFAASIFAKFSFAFSQSTFSKRSAPDTDNGTTQYTHTHTQYIYAHIHSK
jgi:hypothetical protein